MADVYESALLGYKDQLFLNRTNGVRLAYIENQERAGTKALLCCVTAGE